MRIREEEEDGSHLLDEFRILGHLLCHHGDDFGRGQGVHDSRIIHHPRKAIIRSAGHVAKDIN